MMTAEILELIFPKGQNQLDIFLFFVYNVANHLAFLIWLKWIQLVHAVVFHVYQEILKYGPSNGHPTKGFI